jgi:hypothetical protein
MRNLSKLLSAAALTAAVFLPATLAVSTSADARVILGVGINLTPPAAQYEERGAPPWSDGVWIEGHWVRRDGQWVWMHGHWDRPGRGYSRWIPGHYNGNGNWVEGRWR